MDETWRKSFKIGLVLFLIVFIISAIVLIFPVTYLNKLFGCTTKDKMSNFQDAVLQTSNMTNSERNTLLADYKECQAQTIALFGEYNYFLQLCCLFFVVLLFSVPLFFIGKMLTRRDKKYLTFLIPAVYLLLNIVGFLYLRFLAKGFMGLKLFAYIMYVAIFPFLYLILYLPFICMIVSAVACTYLIIRQKKS